MKLIYIAGPYRAPSDYEVHQNIERARSYGATVAGTGLAYPVIPHSNTAHFGGLNGTTDELWLEGTLELMRRCDGVVLTPGWTGSSGSRAEKAEADALGIPVLDLDRHECSITVLRWLIDVVKPRGGQ